MKLKYVDLGSNVLEFVNVPVACPVTYELLGKPDAHHLFTIEDSDLGLLVSADLRDKDSNPIVKITKNEIEKLDDKYKTNGVIGESESFKVIRKEDNVVMFDVKTIHDSIKVTGYFYFGGREYSITENEVLILPEHIRLRGNLKRTSGNCGIVFSGYSLAM